MNGQLTRWLLGNGVCLTPTQRTTHIHVIGQPGIGKSRALESWIMQDIRAGHGVCAIDVHGEMYQNLVSRIALLAAKEPKLAERIVLIDPDDPIWTVGFNPLEPIRGVSQERLAGFLTDVIVKIWQINPTEAPRMVRLLKYTFLALSEFGLSLVQLRRFLQDSEWRDNLIARTSRPQVASYFRFEFPKRAGEIRQWVMPLLNKVEPLVDDPDMRLMLGSKSTINFRKILDQNLVVLVNLSKGTLTEGFSALFGAFLVAHVQQAALARNNSRRPNPYFLYLDEFQNYTTDNIKDILSESRKYGLSLVLAHQFLDQLADDLRGAVLNTAGTLACFRMGYHDASALAREIFAPNAWRDTRPELKFVGGGSYRLPYFQTSERTFNHETLTALLTQLDARELWTKQRGSSLPVKQRTLEMPDLQPSRELYLARKQLINLSGQRYGRLKSEVRQELECERANVNHHTTTYYEPAR